MKSMDSCTKVRSVKVVTFKDDQAFAVCKSCDAEVKIPLRLDEDMLKSMTESETPRVRLYIRTMKSS